VLETDRAAAEPHRAGARVLPAGADPRPRHFRRWFWALVVLALVARIVVVLVTPGYHLIHDDRDYDRIARHVAHGHGYPGDRAKLPDGQVVHRAATYRPPGWPYALGGIYAVFGHDKTAARLVLAVMGAGAVALLGLIALQLFGPRVALWVTGLGALYAPWVAMGSSLVSETFFVTLELAAIACALAARREPRRRKFVALAGAFVGMAALTRVNGILLALPLGLLLWGSPWRSWRSVVRPAALVLMTLLVISPWTIRNAIETGKFIPINTESGETLAGTYNSVSFRDKTNPASWRLPRDTEYKSIKQLGLSGFEVDKRLRKGALDFAGRHPGYPAKVALWNGIRLLDLSGQKRWRFEGATIDVQPGYADAGVYVFWFVALAALVGLALPSARRTLGRAPRWLWLAPGLLLLGTLLVSAETPRHRAPIDPFILLVAAVALASLRGRRSRTAS
jgi:4-amino-4-deoxy-L-arabinose transferase-like glycosyltransferase